MSSCSNFSAAEEISLVSEPSLGNGIYAIKGLDTGEGLIWSPNGKYLAGLIRVSPYPDFCLRCSASHSEIFVIDTDNWERHTVLWLEYEERYISSFSWFPDSQRLAYTSSSNKIGDFGQVWSIDLNGENDIPFMQENGSPVWNPENTKIAIGSVIGVPGDWYHAIYIIDTTTDQKELVFKGKEPISYLSQLSWSSDGKVLAFSYGKIGSDVEPSLKPDIFFLDVATKTLDQFTNDEFEYWSAEFSPRSNLIALQRYNASGIIKDLNSNCEVELPIIGYSYSWSPDGQKLVVSSGRQAYLINLSEFFGSKFITTGSICP